MSLPLDSSSDWLDSTPDVDPGPSSCAVPPAPLPAARFFRFEADGCGARAFESLYEASREPPLSLDEKITGPGGELAYCCEDRVAWVFTRLGERTIAREIHGDRGPARAARRCRCGHDVSNEPSIGLQDDGEGGSFPLFNCPSCRTTLAGAA